MTHLENVFQARSLSTRLLFYRLRHPCHPYRPELVAASFPSSRRPSRRRVGLGNTTFCSFHSGKRLTTVDNTNTSAAASIPICKMPKAEGHSVQAASSNATVQGIPSDSKHNDTSDQLSTSTPTRLLMSSHCFDTVALGKLTIPCLCDAGIFAVSLETRADITCKRCTHRLFNHGSVNSALEDSAGAPQIPPSNTGRPTFLDNPLNSRRENTVTALWKQLQRVQVIHARGTPTSGKSILARLLEEHVKRVRPDMQVYLFNWPASVEGFEYSNYYHLLNKITNEPKTRSDTWLKRQNTLIIVDEAQRSYEFLNFWDEFIKPLASHDEIGPFVIIFSSYGSPSEAPVASSGGSAPVELTTDQRVSIQRLSYTNSSVSLYFTRDEFDDVIERSCRYYSEQDDNPFLPSLELLQYIWEFTNGHPGGVRAVLDMLIQSEIIRPFRQNSLTIPLDVARECIDNEEYLVTALATGPHGFKRSLPKRDALQSNPVLAQFLKEVLVSGKSEDKVESNEALRLCYKRGWLQAEMLAEGRKAYVFPSKLHERYAEILLNNSALEFPLHEFPSVRDLCFSAVRRFSRTFLSSSGPSLSAGAEERPVEAQYRHEFARACYLALSYNLHLTAEWKSPLSNGRVDFQIKSVKWAIKCAREGDRLEDHISRFQPGGRYYPMIEYGEIQDYILLDFRTSKPRMPRDDVPFLYFIVYSDDYATYEIYDAKLNLMVDKVALLE